jgi:hypothetical protein
MVFVLRSFIAVVLGLPLLSFLALLYVSFFVGWSWGPGGGHPSIDPVGWAVLSVTALLTGSILVWLKRIKRSYKDYD